MLPMKFGRATRHIHGYKRHGTASLYTNMASSQIIGRLTKRHRAKEFLVFLYQIDGSTDKTLDVYLILDNGSIYKTTAGAGW